jgi:dihydrofolate reductase
MQIIIIVAEAKGVIGKDGTLPWHFSDDLKRFKDLTIGNPVIMGRKTYESIVKRLGTVLPGRKNIVLSRNKELKVDGHRVSSMDEALKVARRSMGSDKVYIIGGETVYEEALPFADMLEITKIHKEYEGDAFFPKVDWRYWEKVNDVEREEFSFLTYKKKL